MLVQLSGSGNADLYLEFDAEPTVNKDLCRHYKGTSHERCRINVAKDANQVYLMVRGGIKEIDADYKLSDSLD